MAKLFGTNGIRGIFPDEISLEFIHDITLSLATYFKDGPILVGYDGRESSKIIVKTICAALNYAGLDCSVAGLVPTPCLEYATKKLGYNGGIMITASHNPPKYNGIKPVAKDGVEISREDELKIEEIYFAKSWKTKGTWGKKSQEDRAIRTYLDGIKSHLNVVKIKSKKLTVALDLGNGAQATTAPMLCEELGCKVIPINQNIDGTFPGRGSEPTPENLQVLSKTILESGADFGVAFDGDGDRSLFCDNKGIVLTGDKSALLITKHLLEKNPRSTIVTCLNSGTSIEEIAAESDSKVIRTKVGSVEVSRAMVPIKALIGFEENGGFMFGLHNEVRDGAMTLAIVLDILSNSQEKLDKLLEKLPPSYTTKTKVKCSKEDAQKIIKMLQEESQNHDLTDGIKIILDEKNWVMVRPSGTEPIIRIYAESDSKERLDQLISSYQKRIADTLSE